MPRPDPKEPQVMPSARPTEAAIRRAVKAADASAVPRVVRIKGDVIELVPVDITAQNPQPDTREPERW